MANDDFFLGDVEKLVLDVIQLHVLFDDQSGNLATASEVAPSVHI